MPRLGLGSPILYPILYLATKQSGRVNSVHTTPSPMRAVPALLVVSRREEEDLFHLDDDILGPMTNHLPKNMVGKVRGKLRGQLFAALVADVHKR